MEHEVTNREDLPISYEKRVRHELKKIVANKDQSVLDATRTIESYMNSVSQSEFGAFNPETKQVVHKLADDFPYCLLDDDVRLWLNLPTLVAYAPSFRRGLRIHVDEEPRKLHALPLHQYIELKANAKAICKGAVPFGAGGIAPEFIDTKLLDISNHLVWLLLVGNAIHGYAVADEDKGYGRTTLHVHVMCSDRGNGIKLFESVIEYARGSVDAVEIDPLNDDLKSLYEDWGERFGLRFTEKVWNGRTLHALTYENESDSDSESDSESD